MKNSGNTELVLGRWPQFIEKLIEILLHPLSILPGTESMIELPIIAQVAITVPFGFLVLGVRNRVRWTDDS